MKDIVKSSAQFVYVNDPGRVLSARIQIGTPLVGLPQWNTKLEVFIQNDNGTPVEEMGFNPSRIVNEQFVHEVPGDEWYIDSKLGGGHQDLIPDGFDGLKLSLVPTDDDGKFRIKDTNNDEHVCTVWTDERLNPDDKIAFVYFSEFMISNEDQTRNIFIRYTYECDNVSKHTHAVWGMLRLVPDPITMHQVMWFVN